jgi:mannosyltransferase OCH1-like enzyme
MSNQKFLMSEEAMKIAKENSKKQMPSETQKQFIEDSDREIKEIIWQTHFNFKNSFWDNHC